MNRTTRLAIGKITLVSCAALLGALTGCTTYPDQPRSPGGYYEEPPRPRAVYVQPASVPVEGSVGVVIRTADDFYEPLSPYGRWEVVGAYGRCWIPGRVDRDWRPYCNGHWERTDAGWYWASEEPWAWATYHYGRWDLSAQWGWYWMPQTQWATAWVSWHEGGGYVGWAPLQPSARISGGGSVALNVALIAPRAFVFVEPRRFLQPVRPATVVVNNTTIINHTVNITNIKVVNNTVINEGPRTQIIEQASGRTVQAVPVRELRRKQEAAVVARQQTASPGREKMEKNVQTPVRSPVEPRATQAQVEVQRRAKESAATAQQAGRSKAKESERTAQQEAQKRATELQKKAQLEAQQARALKNKTQLDSQRRANEAAAKAPVESPRSASGLEKKAPQVSPPPAGRKPDAGEKGAPKLMKIDLKKKGKDQQRPPAKPANPGLGRGGKADGRAGE